MINQELPLSLLGQFLPTTDTAAKKVIEEPEVDLSWLDSIPPKAESGFDLDWLKSIPPKIETTPQVSRIEKKPEAEKEFDLDWLNMIPPKEMPFVKREPLEIEKRPGLGYIAGETLKGTASDLLKTLERLAQQSKEFLKTTAEQTGAPPMPGQKGFAEYFEKPAPTLKEVGQRGIGLVSFPIKVAIKLYENPHKQITEEPFETLMFLSMIGGLAFKGLKLKSELGNILTKEDFAGVFREVPGLQFDPAVLDKVAVGRLDTTLKQMIPTSARRPEEIPSFVEMPRTRVTQPEEMVPGEEIRIGRDLDTGELVIKIPATKRIEIAPKVPEVPKVSVPIPDVFMRMPLDELIKMADKGVEGAKRALATRKAPGIPTEAPKIAPGGPEKSVETQTIPKTPAPVLPTGEHPFPLPTRAVRRQGLEPEELTGLAKFEYEEKMGGAPRRKEPGRPVLKGTKRTEREYYEQKAAQGVVEDIEKGNLVWEDLSPEEKIAVEHGPYLPEKILELKARKPTETYIAERSIKRKADELLSKTGFTEEQVNKFKANAFMDAEEARRITGDVIAGKKTEVAAVDELRQAVEDTIAPEKGMEAPGRPVEEPKIAPLPVLEKKAKIEPKIKEKAPVKEIPPERIESFEKEIEERLVGQKELTPEQKEYLKKRGMYEEVEATAERPIGEEIPVSVEEQIVAPKERLVKVTIKTPSGDFTQEVTEASIEKIKIYAKNLKVEDKIEVGKPYYGKWKDYLPPAQIETLLKEVMRDVKTLKPEVWEKYAGYPFWPEIKNAYKKLKSEQRIKRAVSLTEIQKELQKTPEGRVEWMYLESRRQLKEKRTPTFKKAVQEAKVAFVDTSGNIKRKLLKDLGEEGRQAVIQHDLIAGTSAKAERVFKKAEGEIYRGLSKEEEGLLNRAIQSRRTIAISKYKPEIKHPMELTGEEHQAYLKKTPDVIQKRADLYFAEMRKALDRLRDEGLLTEEAYQDLASKGDYSPRKFIQYIDPESTYVVGGKTITVPDSGIKALDEGSYGVMETNSRSLLNSVISRTEARISRNKANRSLYELADKVPDNGIVEKAEVYKETKAGKPVYQKTSAGQTKIKVMIEGQAKEMLMPDEFAKEWITRDPLITQKAANIAGWFSGSKILKPMATGINPGFAITNLPKDLIHVWLTTDEYSSFFPKFGAQIARDYLTVAKDAFSRKGRWGDYIDQGGGMSFLTYQGRSIGKGLPGLAKVQEVLGYVGETSEIWTRLALRERAIRNGKTPTEATWVARNYLDFSQGGNVAKMFDSGVPYLNASIQGTRGIFRAIGDRPAQTIWKMAQLGTLASGLLLANRFVNPECWDSIPDREKVNNFIITTPFKTKDKAGNERHFYFKIAKDQAQRVLCTVFENLMGKVLGDKVNGDQIAAAVQDFIPYIPEQNIPPSVSAFLGYAANKDFWRMEDIWKGPKITAREEYTAYTDPAVREIAKKIGASPDRLNYALGEIFTKGNIYTSLMRGGLNAIFDDLPKAYRETAIEKIFKAVPDIKRVFNMTPPYNPQEIKEAKEATVEESTRRYKQRRELEATASQFYKKLYEEKTRDQELFDKAKSFVKSQPPEDRERLANWFVNYGKIYDIPNRSWWLELVSMPPETKATVFWTKYVQSNEKEKEEMKSIARKVPGILSERFSRRFNALLNQWKNENK